MTGGMKDLNVIKGRISVTYAEAIFLLHRLTLANEASLPSVLIQASVVAALFERETVATFDDLKRGMVP